MTLALLLILALQFKHLCADYLFQNAYMVANKGTYGHLAGILHAGSHAVSSLLVLGVFAVPLSLAISLSILEFIVHYHIDWGKDQFSRRRSLTPDKIGFWRAHGVDQALHQATYIAIVWWVFG